MTDELFQLFDKPSGYINIAKFPKIIKTNDKIISWLIISLFSCLPKIVSLTLYRRFHIYPSTFRTVIQVSKLIKNLEG